MIYLKAAILAIIQGLTEFLPVSSSGHLILFHDLLNLRTDFDLSFDVVLHLGTLAALVLFFSREIRQYLVGFFQSFRRWNPGNNPHQRLSWFLVISSVPAAVVGYFWGDSLETFFRSNLSVAIMFVLGGILLLVVEKISAAKLDINQLNLSKVLVIGLAQILAFIPGVSRSGITIIAGMAVKLNRSAAAKFSFLLSIPLVLGAGIKKVSDLWLSGLADVNILLLLISFFVSVIVGYFCIKLFLEFLNKYSLRVFGWYRIFLGLAVLGIIFFG